MLVVNVVDGFLLLPAKLCNVSRNILFLYNM